MSTLGSGMRNEFMNSKRTMKPVGASLPPLRVNGSNSIFSQNIGSDIESIFSNGFGSLMSQLNVSKGDKSLFGNLTQNMSNRFNN